MYVVNVRHTGGAILMHFNELRVAAHAIVGFSRANAVRRFTVRSAASPQVFRMAGQRLASLDSAALHDAIAAELYPDF